MKTRARVMSVSLLIASVCLPAAALAGSEQGKYIYGLSVSTSGAIFLSVKDPSPAPNGAQACAYAVLSLPSGTERDRMYSTLLAARTANLPVNLDFNSSCSVTTVAIP